MITYEVVISVFEIEDGDIADCLTQKPVHTTDSKEEALSVGKALLSIVDRAVKKVERR